MSRKSSFSTKSKTALTLHSAKKPTVTSSLYSGIPNIQREIRQLKSSQSQRLNQSKREFQRTVTGIAENDDSTTCKYYPWKVEYHKIVTREKSIKSMTKDPYTPITRLISYAIEGVTTEIECSLPLIPANAVKTNKINIKQAPRSSLPTTIRYLRRNELMPSERPKRPSTSFKLPSPLPQTESKPATIPILNTNKTSATAPVLVTKTRLLNRAKTVNDPSTVRKPPRKLVINMSHETILPLSVYG